LGEIIGEGETAKAAEKLAREEQERRAEVFEVETDLLKAGKLVEAAKNDGKPISVEKAYRIVLEWKATRDGQGFTIPGLVDELGPISKALLGKALTSLTP
jgi:uncharacterized protein YndB with AHSA1/START domain